MNILYHETFIGIMSAFHDERKMPSRTSFRESLKFLRYKTNGAIFCYFCSDLVVHICRSEGWKKIKRRDAAYYLIAFQKQYFTSFVYVFDNIFIQISLKPY